MLIALALSGIGLLMIYSASYYSASIYYNDPFFFLRKQGISFIAALCCFFVSKQISISSIKCVTPFMYVISLIMLALVFVPGIGVENYGAKRWLSIGGISFQPSELAKYVLVLVNAKILASNNKNFLKYTKVAILSSFVLVLILLQPNMSIVITVFCSVILMLIFGGLKIKNLAIIAIPIIVFGILLVLKEPYRLNRLKAFLNPWESPLEEGYQLIQSYFALAGGGLKGVGLFNSKQKLLFLPFAESDFIFSIIGEEFGLIGSIIVILLFLGLLIEGILVAKQAVSKYEVFISVGIISIITIQSLFNIAVVSGSIPPTGLPMPFISYGGSSLCIIFFFLGILENIKKNSLEQNNMNKIY